MRALAELTWFRVGGPAEVLFQPADAADLAAFLAACPAGIPVTPVGVGSNLLVRDGGVAGVVVRLGRGFAAIETDGDRVTAGAMALDLGVAKTAAKAGVAGLEFLSGVPGTIGGALRMNAGAFGSDMAAVLIEATAIDRDGREHCLGRDDMGFAYRSSAVPEDWIFTAATLQGAPGDEPEIAARMADIADLREASQPLRSRTGGSTFKNPEGARAWELIEAAGCRGLTRGGAMVSEKHCNFLINTGSASAADIEGLGEEVRRRVSETCGVTLEWEIKRVGRHPANAVGGAP
ncbi:MAG: UDP-N-acetylmuramate dehydrogenase [Proteobacteria bacterium]|nr:UDP-N-acetylmuramate dehydrogenase [Pseudomonadota bacterium]